MKAHFEFKTEKEYVEYLRAYFTGQALAVLPMMKVRTNPESLATTSVAIANEIINQLKL